MGASKPLRLIALPLTKPRASPVHSRGFSKDELVYLHSIAPSRSSKPLSYMTRVTNWAGSQWDKLGQAPVTNWKHRIFVRGNQLLDNIEFEEWSLKGLDKELGPDLWSLKSDHHKSPGKTETDSGANSKQAGLVPLLYPSKYLDEPRLRQHIQDFLQKRLPYHRKWVWWSLGLSPLTWPFAIVPVIPNFPLFYVLWRAWSHWRAATSSQYLLDLITRDQIKFQPSSALDAVLDRRKEEHGLLLSEAQLDVLCSSMKLDEQARADFKRAIVQAEARLREVREDTHR